ncbi:MAG: hypothetical protein JRH11_21050 [Deltaproteobacteria bacterium]|nr:hypothetical protein [Deltaproteobacteria bacterium]
MGTRHQAHSALATVALLLIAGCTDAPTETATVTIDGVEHVVVDAYGVVEGDARELFFTFDDDSTFILGVDGGIRVRRQVNAASPGLFAIHTPAGGGPFTWFARPFATGDFLIDGDDTSAEGDFSLDLRRPSDESVLLEGIFSGVPLTAGVVTHHGSSFECRMRAYRASGEYFAAGRLVNNGDSDFVVLGSQFNTTASVTIFVPRDVVPGQYLIGADGVSAHLGDNPYSGQASSGNVRILEHDMPEQRIVGDFSFEGVAYEPAGTMVPFLVNAGAFDMRYTLQD